MFLFSLSTQHPQHVFHISNIVTLFFLYTSFTEWKLHCYYSHPVHSIISMNSKEIEYDCFYPLPLSTILSIRSKEDRFNCVSPNPPHIICRMNRIDFWFFAPLRAILNVTLVLVTCSIYYEWGRLCATFLTRYYFPDKLNSNNN